MTTREFAIDFTVEDMDPDTKRDLFSFSEPEIRIDLPSGRTIGGTITAVDQPDGDGEPLCLKVTAELNLDEYLAAVRAGELTA